MLDLGYVDWKRKRKKLTGLARQEVGKKLARASTGVQGGGRAAQGRAGVKVGPEWQESDLVFVNPSGRPLDPDAVSKKLKGILTDAGLLADRPVHKLRHSCASVLIAHDVDALVVKEVLGHSQISLTLSVYAHLFPGAHRVAASAMDAAYGDSTVNTMPL